MKLATSAQMKAMDREAIEGHGIPSALLMSRAADGLVQAIGSCGREGPIAVLCGSGNNGGDGICAAAKLLLLGRGVTAILTGSPEKMTDDSRQMLARLEELGGSLLPYADTEEIHSALQNASIIVDAMLGTGLNAPLRGTVLSAVRAVNASGAYVIAADMPTGVSADTGAILEDAVQADITVTFSLGKVGQFTEPGCVCCGRVTVWDIGIPADLIESCPCDTFAVMPGEVSIPRRKKLTHKGDYGRDLILAGSLGFTGAPVMAAEAAQRVGAGLVYLGVPDSIYSITAIRCTEVMPQPVPCDEEGLISWDARSYVREMLGRCDSALAGPGMGTSVQLQYLLELLIRESTIPLVLDADALNTIAADLSILRQAKAPLILTPHPGEFSRLGGSTEAGRIEGARAFAKAHGCYLVLKGHRTVTALPDGRVYLNTTGGPAMAKGGSGDVLAGMITGLLGQGFAPDDAAIAGVWLHGLAGDLCAEKLGEYSVVASDLIAAIGEAIRTTQQNSGN